MKAAVIPGGSDVRSGAAVFLFPFLPLLLFIAVDVGLFYFVVCRGSLAGTRFYLSGFFYGYLCVGTCKNDCKCRPRSRGVGGETSLCTEEFDYGTSHL